MSLDKDEEWAMRRMPDNIYISEGFDNVEDGREKRFLHLVIDPQVHDEFATVNKQVVIRESPGGREQISAVVYRDSREITSLILQRFATESGKPYRASFSLHGEDISKLLQFVEFAKAAPFAGRQRIGLDEAALKALAFSKDTLKSLVLQHQDVIAEIISQNVTKEDIAVLAHRRKVLSHFRRLLTDDAFFSSEAKVHNGGERVWQAFFEENKWIFGYGLLYTSLEAFRGKPLERAVAGRSISGRGKRVDALLKTRGEISAICFVEIKTHKTPLLGQEYRGEAWAISRELAGAVAQCQRTVQSALLDLGKTRHDETNYIGDPTGESAYLYRPRSMVVAGKLGEFEVGSDINETKYASFELFRRQLQSPEIITFDELLSRASFIVEVEEPKAGNMVRKSGD